MATTQMQVRHPLDAMQVSIQAYGFTGKPLIKLGLNKARGEKIFKQLKLALTRFDMTVNNSIQQFNMSLTKQSKNSSLKAGLILSNLQSALNF